MTRPCHGLAPNVLRQTNIVLVSRTTFGMVLVSRMTSCVRLIGKRHARD